MSVIVDIARQLVAMSRWHEHISGVVYVCLDATRRFIFQGDTETYHPNKPLNSLPVLITIVRERDFVILVVLRTKVKLHAGTFKDTLRLAGSVVDEGWDAAVCYEIQSAIELVISDDTTSARDLGIHLTPSRFNEVSERVLRLISRNHGSFCWFLLNSSLWTLYCRPSSSSVMEILWPLGVPAFTFKNHQL
jgi:hypothetical protein